MEIKRVGSQPSSRGSADYFTGAARLDPLFQAPDPHLSAPRNTPTGACSSSSDGLSPSN